MTKPRARDLGIPFEGETGQWNSITDVQGVTVGYSTIIEGDSARTGVTIIHPRGKDNHDPVFAGWFPFNGNGEMTGSAWVEEGGFLEGPIGITNTHSVGVVRDTIIQWQAEQDKIFQGWSCPLVTETADGWLNDINGFFVKPEHVLKALNNAKSGLIEEGNVGGGTGMLCYEFKGGSGTSSRRLPKKLGGWTVGAFAQTNFGRRFQLTVAGVPVGQHLKEGTVWTNGENPFKQDDGSLIIILATDAPLLPHQLKRLAKRASLGMARTGSLGGNGSGDIFLAFSTANPNAARGGENGLAPLQSLSNNFIDPLLMASGYATEEAIINSMIAAEEMMGRNGLSVKALPHEELRDVMKRYNRIMSR
ncbi:MAG TPA: P1 family peptidase [Anaerolineales bacterium]|nr:P1 family peptidase [Anaerolineales bacterium]